MGPPTRVATICNPIIINQQLIFCPSIADINDCRPNSCSGNGQCVDLVNTIRCNCNAGFTGERCETSKEPVFFSTASLIDNPHISDLHTVVIFFIGVTTCTPDVCLNGGQCIQLANRITCNCQNGFTGSRCEDSK